MRKTAIPQFKISMKCKNNPADLPSITEGSQIPELIRGCFDNNSLEWVESFIVIALNRGNKVMGFFEASKGGMNGTVADPRVIFQFALLSGAANIILAHNHPSGTLFPSRADIEMTNRLKAAGDLLEIKVLDHVIITRDGHYSFAEQGQI